MSYIWRKLSIFLVCFALLVNFFVFVPTAEASVFGMSTKQEIDLGREVSKELEKKYGLVNDLELQERVSRIGNRIVAISDRKDLPYTFKVLNSKEVNALACPGGFIYIFKGLVDNMPSDDELAGIIGHEVGHVVKRHTVKEIEKSQRNALLFLIAFGSRGATLQSLAYNALMAGYSRDDEREADYMGVVHTMRAGYNPYSMLIGMQKIAEQNHEGANWFSSHPDPESRIALIQGYLNDAKVRPQVVKKDQAAQIVDKDLALPPLYATFRGYKPLYRADFAAGILYQLSKLPDFNGDRFILDSDGTYITIFYDDREVLVLTPQDASANNTSLESLAGQYVSNLKAWAGAKQ
jgi:predicted Zn-dependent protease